MSSLLLFWIFPEGSRWSVIGWVPPDSPNHHLFLWFVLVIALDSEWYLHRKPSIMVSGRELSHKFHIQWLLEGLSSWLFRQAKDLVILPGIAVLYITFVRWPVTPSIFWFTWTKRWSSHQWGRLYLGWSMLRETGSVRLLAIPNANKHLRCIKSCGLLEQGINSQVCAAK